MSAGPAPAPPTPPAPARGRFARFVRSEVGVAWIGVGMAVVMGVPAWLALRPGPDGGSGERPGPATPSGASSTPSAGSSTTPGASSRASSTASGTSGAQPMPTAPCVDVRTGAATGCDGPSAGVALQLPGCTADDALTFWGLDPGRDALLVDVVGRAGRCLVAPSTPARQTGATALDLARLPGGAVPASLRACARSGGAVTVSCGAVHTLEWVGGWRARGVADEAQECVTAGRSYTDDTLAGADGELQAVAVRGAAGGYRCAITVRNGQLNGSVAALGGGPLPTVP